jgi:hypothetical protein
MRTIQSGSWVQLEFSLGEISISPEISNLILMGNITSPRRRAPRLDVDETAKAAAEAGTVSQFEVGFAAAKRQCRSRSRGSGAIVPSPSD